MVHQRNKANGEWFVDVSQTLTRLTSADQCPRADVVPCLTGSSMLWCVVRQRLLTGIEAMRLQGMSVKSVPALLDCPQTLAHDLAGNAFNANAALSAFIAFHCAVGLEPSYIA